MNHKYSTYAGFIVLFMVVIFAIASAITSEEVDEICAIDEKILYRQNGTWACAEMNLEAETCAEGEQTFYNGTNFVCVSDAIGDTNTSYTENSPYLTLTGTEFGFSEAKLNQTCSDLDTDTTYTATDYIILDGTAFGLNETWLNDTIDDRDSNTNTQLSEAQVEAMIFDDDNTDTLETTGALIVGDNITLTGNMHAYDYNIMQVEDPLVAPTGIVSAGGSVDDGTHRYYVTFITATGETHVSPQSAIITTTTGQNTVTLTIPTSPDPRVIGRKIYRSKAGQVSFFQEYYLDTISNNIDTEYIDIIPDASLGTYQTAVWRIDSTTDFIKINNERAFVIDPQAVWVGIGAGESVTTGGNNVLIGTNAGTAITSGGSNTYVGANTGLRHSGGNLNTAIGTSSLAYLTTGSDNVAVGGYSLYKTTGSGSVAVGKSSLQMITGVGNTALGHFAGAYYGTGTSSLTSGNYNIYIGWKARASTNAVENEIVIGKNIEGLGSNTVRLGNSDTTLTALEGNIGIGTLSPQEELHVVENILANGTINAITNVQVNSVNVCLSNGTNCIAIANGTDGIDGVNGSDGYTPIKGVDYFDGINGSDGADGANGTSVNISNVIDNTDGTFTWVFSDGYNFTTSNLTGPIGPQGIQGIPGINGTDGADGIDGVNGSDGYTPIKGVDYFDGTDGIDAKNADQDLNTTSNVTFNSASFHHNVTGYYGPSTSYKAWDIQSLPAGPGNWYSILTLYYNGIASIVFDSTAMTEFNLGIEVSDIHSDDWSNVTITESQISDLTHTVDTDTTYSHLSNFTDDIGVSADYDSLSDLQTAVSNDFHNLGGTDANTEYSESDKYLTLSGTVFGIDESVLNATCSALDTDTNTQLSEAQVDTYVSNNGYLTDYTVTEEDVTAHETALSITESQISDLTHTVDTNLNEAEVEAMIFDNDNTGNIITTGNITVECIKFTDGGQMCSAT